MKPTLTEQLVDDGAPVYSYFLSLLEAFRHSGLILNIGFTIYHDLPLTRAQIDFLAVDSFEPTMLMKAGEKEIQTLGLHRLVDRKQILYFTRIKINQPLEKLYRVVKWESPQYHA